MEAVTLAEVAADVAAAIGPKAAHGLRSDGSNLANDCWHFYLEKWLLENGWNFSAGNDGHEAWRFDDSMPQIIVQCAWPEAPARLVSAVWRARKEEGEEAMSYQGREEVGAEHQFEKSRGQSLSLYRENRCWSSSNLHHDWRYASHAPGWILGDICVICQNCSMRAIAIKDKP